MKEEQIRKKAGMYIKDFHNTELSEIDLVLFAEQLVSEITKELQNRLNNQAISIKSYQEDLQTGSKIIEQFLSLKNAANKRNEVLKILDVRKEAEQFLNKIRNM
jgi:hypothetical protein